MQLLETETDFVDSGHSNVLEVGVDSLDFVVRRSGGCKSIDIDLELLDIHAMEVFAEGRGELGNRERHLVAEKQQYVVNHGIIHCKRSFSRIEKTPKTFRKNLRNRALQVSKLIQTI